ncbi:MAG: oxidative damage protection protein [Legionellales bacterium]|nr:oxidative damage protection protein [Legionellales bacterium]|tara:strand:+ start:385 stop:633 length:249 start_codon:yes stop_codon:yes gene_type:complete
MPEVYCVKLKKNAPGLEVAPYPGPLGERIAKEISQEAWKMWVAQQTILINENRLMLHDPKARAFLEAEMEKFFFSDEDSPQT